MNVDQLRNIFAEAKFKTGAAWLTRVWSSLSDDAARDYALAHCGYKTIRGAKASATRAEKKALLADPILASANKRHVKWLKEAKVPVCLTVVSTKHGRYSYGSLRLYVGVPRKKDGVLIWKGAVEICEHTYGSMILQSKGVEWSEYLGVPFEPQGIARRPVFANQE